MPEGAASYYYHDVFLSLAAAWAFLFVFVGLTEQDFHALFWGALSVCVICVLLARNRATPVTTALLSLAVRLGVAFLETRHLGFLGGCVLCIVLSISVFRRFGGQHFRRE
jgi:hypothetical protein